MEEAPLVIDKSSWPRGPWDQEPDRKEFVASGFPCLMQRHVKYGNWCGYVAVPPGHPAHGKDYNDIVCRVHGGLTYGSLCEGHICHVPKPGEPDNVFWLGFDCAHAGDFSPGMNQSYAKLIGETYRDEAYVEAETRALATQLAKMKP